MRSINRINNLVVKKLNFYFFGITFLFRSLCLSFFLLLFLSLCSFLRLFIFLFDLNFFYPLKNKKMNRNHFLTLTLNLRNKNMNEILNQNNFYLNMICYNFFFDAKNSFFLCSFIKLSLNFFPFFLLNETTFFFTFLFFNYSNLTF